MTTRFPITELVDTIDRSSGMLHRRIQVEGVAELATFEGDNLDTAGPFDIVTKEVAGAYRATHPHKVCKRCHRDESP